MQKFYQIPEDHRRIHVGIGAIMCAIWVGFYTYYFNYLNESLGDDSYCCAVDLVTYGWVAIDCSTVSALTIPYNS